MAQRLRVVFLGTPEFSVPTLDALAREHEVVAVYSQPDKPVGRGRVMTPPPVKARALELGIPVFQPDRVSVPEEIERIRALRPDVMVVVAYGQLLKQAVLDLPRLGCVNIHSSLLPRWRGAAPIQWAILGGDAETGVTTMKMALKLDAGDILMVEKVPLDGTMTAGRLHDTLMAMGARLILPTLGGLAEGTLPGRVQDESQVTYASKLTKEMEWLDPTKPAAELDRQIRALNPWPGTSVKLEAGERLKIRGAVLRAGLSVKQGTLDERHGMLLLGAADGALELTRVQPDGKKEQTPTEFVNGLKGRGLKLPLSLERPGG